MAENTLTVKELKEILAGFDDDAKICVEAMSNPEATEAKQFCVGKRKLVYIGDDLSEIEEEYKSVSLKHELMTKIRAEIAEFRDKMRDLSPQFMYKEVHKIAEMENLYEFFEEYVETLNTEAILAKSGERPLEFIYSEFLKKDGIPSLADYEADKDLIADIFEENGLPF